MATGLLLARLTVGLLLVVLGAGAAVLTLAGTRVRSARPQEVTAR